MDGLLLDHFQQFMVVRHRCRYGTFPDRSILTDSLNIQIASLNVSKSFTGEGYRATALY